MSKMEKRRAALFTVRLGPLHWPACRTCDMSESFERDSFSLEHHGARRHHGASPSTFAPGARRGGSGAKPKKGGGGNVLGARLSLRQEASEGGSL